MGVVFERFPAAWAAQRVPLKGPGLDFHDCEVLLKKTVKRKQYFRVWGWFPRS